jgi:hypothetical protein
MSCTGIAVMAVWGSGSTKVALAKVVFPISNVTLRSKRATWIDFQAIRPPNAI